ncbi:hypothetical protein HHI36_020727 [Cryptolaemus montrouzieri]|uniref:TIL domain-containing protein n=1 Tax=Cryptolaemus montrouzieri TaxID=559131 RepID=A0ABD2NCQ9_9CUCU
MHFGIILLLLLACIKHSFTRPPCGENEVYDQCGSRCTPSCQSRPTFCTFECVPGCYCEPNYIKDHRSGKCVRSCAEYDRANFG